jgi:hypothetical protein
VLTLRDILEQRRQQLLEFFAWRFGTPQYTKALVYCSGLHVNTIQAFRRGPVSYDVLLTIEDAALHLGYRPSRMVNKSGKFTKPKALRLPRWSEPTARIRFYQWKRQFERKSKCDTMSHLKRQDVSSAPSPDPVPNPDVLQPVLQTQ